MVLWIIKYSVEFLGYYFSKVRSHTLANIPLYIPNILIHMECFFKHICIILLSDFV